MMILMMSDDDDDNDDDVVDDDDDDGGADLDDYDGFGSYCARSCITMMIHVYLLTSSIVESFPMLKGWYPDSILLSSNISEIL